MRSFAVLEMFSSAMARLVALSAQGNDVLRHPVPTVAADFERVVGAGLRKRQKSSFPKGRAAKHRFAGTAGKIRP